MTNQSANLNELTDTLTENPIKRLWIRFLGVLLFGPSELGSAVIVSASGPIIISGIGRIISIATISDVCSLSIRCHLAHDIENTQHVVTALVHPVATLHQIPDLAMLPFVVGVIFFYLYLVITSIYLFRELFNLGRFVTRSIRKVTQRLKPI